MKKYKVNPEDVGTRADIFVANKFNDFARSALKPLFDSGDIRINSVKAKTGYKLRGSDVVEIDDSKLNADVPDIDMPIIYEDENVIVINKPAGILSHARGGLQLEPSVASFVRSKLKQELADSNQRAGIVHRLDRATSGVMICAKDSQTLKYLQKQFAKKSTQKTYLAVVYGIMKNPTAVIEAPISRNPKKPTRFRVHGSGKPATTKYKVIKQAGGFSYLELEPLTGRTHQLRVHMHYLNHPIVGDWLYGGQSADRLMLHAKNLRLRLPSGEDRTFTAELPAEFVTCLKDFGLYG